MWLSCMRRVLVRRTLILVRRRLDGWVGLAVSRVLRGGVVRTDLWVSRRRRDLWVSRAVV